MSEGAGPIERVDIVWGGLRVAIEHQWLWRERDDAPLIVFLHEGLGCVRMWKDWPLRLCAALGWRGLVYSRPGYGGSRIDGVEPPWAPDFMHRQAFELLPTLLAALGVDAGASPPWLLGHSDGGSIALLHAACFPSRVAGAVVIAPHILVEDLSVRSIEAARQSWRDTDLRQRLARHHDDPERVFRRWNDIWLAPAFRHWSIEHEVAAIRCPLMAVQGTADEYGTLEQIRGIARRVPQTRLLELADCGHWPHRDRPDELIDAVACHLRGPGPAPAASRH